jgi:pimeloyl-ACP methyl ester carboxylesterase
MKRFLIAHSCLLLVYVLVASQDGPPQYGSYEVEWQDYDFTGVLHDSNSEAVVVYPKKILEEENNEEVFPMLVFAHGFLAGGFYTHYLYRALLDGVASFGFIVVAPRSCIAGCRDYYNEQLKVIDWVNNNMASVNDSVFQFVNRTAGYGVFGHSMGGQATMQALTFADEHDICAGVVLHPAPIRNPQDMKAPAAFFTGRSEERNTRPMYEASPANPKAYARMLRGLHTEPNFGTTKWSMYVAAWFHILLNNDDGYYYNLIYGNEPDSLCGGSIPMANDCEASE